MHRHQIAPEGVWIVSHDESPHNTVLGVFTTQDEASAFADEVERRFTDGVIYSRYPVGYRYDRGSGHVTYGPRS
jgi:hypothetical protein